ncbi:hypothetical protein QCD60_12755 [Pokkaliibacter sp. MBI-7]|uniref:hypothetical protein n=1 Tax=Pokkaliibacter sp. MBI-7 TaxID=3040600 RepID=UPI00244C1CCA|nr:hypothetical protein [Pokkaliibacter sp. MBI-7]MDH2433443.1 hypothetical protein [Pokkaliibacter sp. MBI-7]
MIPVQLASEPDDFDAKVRKPGQQWLAGKGIPPASVPPKFKWNDLWSKCSDQLHERYSGICAFSGFYIERVTGARTVEHFQPKKHYPDLAYEWSNYRLVCSLLNGSKGDHSDVLDPCTLPANSFTIDFVTGKVAAHAAAVNLGTQIEATIRRLKLNREECCKTRIEYLNLVKDGHISADFLQKRSPFVWYEAHRQGLL